MSSGYCNAIVDSSEEYVGVLSRPEVFDGICGDEAFQSLQSALNGNLGTASSIIPASQYDLKFGMDTRQREYLLNHGSTFEDQLAFGSERLPAPADVVGATLDDYKVGVGYITSNSKDFPVSDIQTLRPYIPAPPTGNSIFGFPEVADTAAFGVWGESAAPQLQNIWGAPGVVSVGGL
eukprot:jgi/Mesvir1/17490/Mv08758-RA.1